MLIFKYLGRFAADLLRDRRIKVTPPVEFNDPFEFTPNPVGRMKTRHVKGLMAKELQRRTYDDMVAQGMKMSWRQFRKLLKENKQYVLQKAQAVVEKHILDYRHTHLNSVSKDIGIVCFSRTKSDILMWSHYADAHTGIALGFDRNHSFFRGDGVHDVDYEKNRVKYDLSWGADSQQHRDYIRKMIRAKSEHWAYEQEVRVAFRLLDCVSEKTKDGRTLYFQRFPPECLTQIVFGCRCQPEFKQAILLSVKQGYPNISFETAELHPTEFALNFVTEKAAQAVTTEQPIAITTSPVSPGVQR